MMVRREFLGLRAGADAHRGERRRHAFELEASRGSDAARSCDSF